MIRQPVDEALNSLELVHIVDRAIQNVIAAWVTRRGVCLDLGYQQRQELVVHRFVNQDAGRRGAVLTGVEETCNGNLCCRFLKVGVGTNYYRCLAT